MDFVDNGFKNFASALEERLKSYEVVPRKELLAFQRKQIKNLISLENKFRRTLIRDKRGASVYKKFVDHITVEKANILAARPFFRERQTVFSEFISELLKKKKHKGLYRFRFNYNFILFVMKQYKWGANSELVRLEKLIQKQRLELVEMNIPLAISQARIFWSHTPKSHLSYMDLMQIHCMGLLIAIDKFVPPPKGLSEDKELEEYRKFRAVAIGRMTGDRIEEYSQTMLHFFPADKRKIYRALKALRNGSKDTEVDLGKIVESVNDGVPDKKHHTTTEEIANLLAGSSHVSGDLPIGENDGETYLDQYEDQNSNFPEKIEQQQAVDVVSRILESLTCFERKIMKMKGYCS